jgi:hypothetical protein
MNYSPSTEDSASLRGREEMICCKHSIRKDKEKSQLYKNLLNLASAPTRRSVNSLMARKNSRKTDNPTADTKPKNADFS